jgi:hypothetical protein
MKIASAGLVVAAILLTWATAADAQTLRLRTVEDLVRSPPQKLQSIRVLGQVDNCFDFTCNLCPVSMTDREFSHDKCLGLSFEGFASGGRSVTSLMDRAFRFATVVLDAQYDPTCVPSPSKEFICTDKASVITHARVIEVRSRKSALDGIVTWYNVGRLVEPSAEDREAMMQKVALQWSPDFKMRVFRIVDPQYIQEKEAGLGCVCLEDSCEGRWPARYFYGFESTANPFECLVMVKKSSEWQFEPY